MVLTDMAEEVEVGMYFDAFMKKAWDAGSREMDVVLKVWQQETIDRQVKVGRDGNITDNEGGELKTIANGFRFSKGNIFDNYEIFYQAGTAANVIKNFAYLVFDPSKPKEDEFIALPLVRQRPYELTPEFKIDLAEANKLIGDQLAMRAMALRKRGFNARFWRSVDLEEREPMDPRALMTLYNPMAEYEQRLHLKLKR